MDKKTKKNGFLPFYNPLTPTLSLKGRGGERTQPVGRQSFDISESPLTRLRIKPALFKRRTTKRPSLFVHHALPPKPAAAPGPGRLMSRLRRVAIKPLPWRRWWQNDQPLVVKGRKRWLALGLALGVHGVLAAVSPHLRRAEKHLPAVMVRLAPPPAVKPLAKKTAAPPLPAAPKPPAPQTAEAPLAPPPKPETRPSPTPRRLAIKPLAAPRPTAPPPPAHAPPPAPEPVRGGDSPAAPAGTPVAEAPPVSSPVEPAHGVPVEPGGAPGQTGRASSRRVRERPGPVRSREPQSDRRERGVPGFPRQDTGRTTPPPVRPAKPVYTNSSRGGYLAGLKNALEARKTYPPLAEREGMTGEVTLSLTISPDGGLRATVAKSSGYPLLDQAALAAVQGLGHYRAFAQDMAPKNLHQQLVLRFVLE